MRAEHAELVASLDQKAPGLAVLRLQEFARRRERYALALAIQDDIARWQALLEPAYRNARDLARDGAFDEAERVLVDLALVPDEPAGRLSRDFSRSISTTSRPRACSSRATRSSGPRRRTAGAGPAARRRTDGGGPADARHGRPRQTGRRDDEDDRAAIGGENGAGLPGVVYVKYGSYPERFTLDDPALEMGRSTRTLDAVARFKDYRGDADTFSLIVVGKSGARFLVTDRTVEPAALRAVTPK